MSGREDDWTNDELGAQREAYRLGRDEYDDPEPTYVDVLECDPTALEDLVDAGGPGRSVIRALEGLDPDPDA